MSDTRIEWTDKVWNCITGCSPVSAGCAHCYARGIANRFWGDRKFTDVRCHQERLSQPLHWKKPRRIFVNSMSDLFHDAVPDQFILSVFMTMESCPHHSFQILTKRPKRMLTWCKNQKTLPNVWLGVSVEDQKTADERIPILLQTPAAIRFVSYEPALGPVDFEPWIWPQCIDPNGCHQPDECDERSLDWIIAGSESGPQRRASNIDWFRTVRDQCVEAYIPFFLKQMNVAGQLIKMPELDGVVWNQFPEESET